MYAGNLQENHPCGVLYFWHIQSLKGKPFIHFNLQTLGLKHIVPYDFLKSYNHLPKDNYIQIKDIFSSDMFRYYKETKNLKRYANKMVSEYSCKDVDSLLD